MPLNTLKLGAHVRMLVIINDKKIHEQLQTGYKTC